MPKISIIVPVYNVEEYLPRCIDSILAQTFTDFELILVDDGSPDNCPQICDDYAQKDNRIKVIHKENGGLSSARNAGIELAISDFVGFVDSDDWIDPNMYSVLYNLQKKYNADIAECSFVKCTAFEFCDHSNTMLEKVFSKEAAVIQLYKCECYGSTVAWNKLYKKSLFDDLKYPVGRNNEDQFLTPRLFFVANKVASCNYVGYYYYYRENSIMNSNFTIKKIDAVSSFMDTRSFLQENKLFGALEYHDATYAFILLKYWKLFKDNDYSKSDYRIIINEFNKLFLVFIRNKHLNLKSKIILIFRRLMLG